MQLNTQLETSLQPVTHSAHSFTSEDFDSGNMPFDPAEYSMLKFGSDVVAKKFGWEVAESFFHNHLDILLERQAIIVPSPYNFIPNAAMVMTQHLVRRLNHLLADVGGRPVEFSLIRRKLNFTIDYGFLSKEDRVHMLTKDKMYLNSEYLEDKTIIFADDIRITGTNELCMKTLFDEHPRLSNSPVVFLYFAKLLGTPHPSIEGRLNLSSITTLKEYVALSRTPNHHIIVRPIKFILSCPRDELNQFLMFAPADVLEEIYFGAIGENYHMVPEFVESFTALKKQLTLINRI